MLSRTAATYKGILTKKDNDDSLCHQQTDACSNSSSSNKMGLWQNAKLTLNRAKQEARRTWRTWTFRVSTLKRQVYRASLPAENGAEWQESEANRTLCANHVNSRDSADINSDTHGSGAKSASVYTELEHSIGNVKKSAKASSKKNGRLTATFKQRADDEDPGIMSESETSATGGSGKNGSNRRNVRTKHHNGSAYPSSHSTYNVKKAAANAEKSLGLVFLHYQGETKRALLPDEIHTLDDARNLFLKAFPISLTPEYLNSSKVKVYIQDPTRQDVFYELDDLNEIKDRTVLKLHEQSRPLSPTPLIDQQQASCLSAMPAAAALYDTSETISSLKRQQSDSQVPICGDESSLDDSSSKSVKVKSCPLTVDNNNKTVMNHSVEFCSRDDLEYVGGHSTGYRGSNRFPTTVTAAQYSLQQQGSGPFEPRQHYGTLDSAVLRNSTDRENKERVRYNSLEPPMKPQRYFSNSLGGNSCTLNRGGGVGLNGTGTATGRCSRSPPTSAALASAPALTNYGTGSESKIDTQCGSSIRDRNYPCFADGQIYHGNGSSDRSNSVSRCGSATPVIDEEARVRMMSMEKQLANLSSLVHSALMAKGVSETVYKDIEMLRREILGPHRDDVSDTGSLSRFSDISAEQLKNSQSGKFSLMSGRDYFPSAFRYTSGGSNNNGDSRLNQESQITLKTAKKRLVDLQADLKHLRRTVQLNAQTTNDVLKDSFDRVKLILNTNKHIQLFAIQAHQQNLVEANPLLSDRSWVNQEQERYRSLMKKVEQDLSEFEKHVEDLRQKVVNGERKIRLAEVETFTDSLTYIGRTAANLKTQFPSLQQRLKYVMGAEMEKVVREEKFLKDEPLRLDNALQRCKKLTGTMLTMKKLAIVQDRSTSSQNGNRERPASATPQSTQNLLSAINSSTIEKCSNIKQLEAPPLIPPPPKHYDGDGSSAFSTSYIFRNNANGSSMMMAPKSTSVDALNGGGVKSGSSGNTNYQNCNNSSLLDTLLDELQTVTCSDRNEAKPTAPPPPPSSFFASGSTGQQTLIDTVGASDTIKRSPKSSGSSTVAPLKFNCPLGNSISSTTDKQQPTANNLSSFDSFALQKFNGNKPGASRNSESPIPIGQRLLVTDRPPERCHSVTPSPMMSQFDSSQSASCLMGTNRDPPPPPPRSSSRTVLNNSAVGTGGLSYSGAEINDFKQQLTADSAYKNSNLVAITLSNNNNINDTPLQKFPPAEVKILNTAETRTSWPVAVSVTGFQSGHMSDPPCQPRPISRGNGIFPQPFNGRQQQNSKISPASELIASNNNNSTLFATNNHKVHLATARELFFKNGDIAHTQNSIVEEQRKSPFRNNNYNNNIQSQSGKIYNGSRWI